MLNGVRQNDARQCFKQIDIPTAPTHAPCLCSNRLFDPNHCLVCQPHVTVLLVMDTLGQKSDLYIQLRHHWASVCKMLSHHKLPAKLRDSDLRYRLGFRNSNTTATSSEASGSTVVVFVQDDGGPPERALDSDPLALDSLSPPDDRPANPSSPNMGHPSCSSSSMPPPPGFPLG